jgi:hypothetical protein
MTAALPYSRNHVGAGEINSNNENVHSLHNDNKHEMQKSSRSRKNMSRSSALVETIRQSNFHDHDAMIYPDLSTFRQVYSEAAKEALERNEIVFLATTYDSFQRVIDSLTHIGISVNREAKDGNLIILDAVKAYQIDTVGAYKFAETLVKRAVKDGKAGVFNISDMGSFFLTERIPRLLPYEEGIPKKMMDLEFKGICAYHKDDFANLSKEQQEMVISSHNRMMT